MLEQFKTVTSAPNRHQKVHKSVDKWVWMGFYQSLKTVMDRVLQEEISQNLNGDIHDIVSVIDDTKQEIFDAIDEAGTTLESFPKAESGRGKKTVEVAKVDTKKAKKKTTRKRKVDVSKRKVVKAK
jgi:hypothetical protein